jgi:glycosyltransferase involved in cell wall biosynthesis
MKKAKILFYNSSFFTISETFIRRQIAGILNDFDVQLLSLRREGEFSGVEGNIKHEVLLSNKANPIDRIISRILLSSDEFESYFSLVKRTRIKKVISSKDLSILHIHYGTHALRLLPIIDKIDLPVVVSFHGYDASRMTQNKLYMRKLPTLFNRADKIVVCTPYMINQLKLDPWLEKVQVIPYGIDTDYFKCDRIDKSNKELITITHAGRITEKKGVIDLIISFSDVVKMTNNIQLNILGDGNELVKCRFLAKELGIEGRINFLGAQPNEKVKSILAETDIFVLNSRTASDGDMEGLPNTLLESMSMGKAVVSTRHAGIPTLIKHEENGILVEPKNNIELANALLMLVQDKSFRNQLGDSARKTVESDFTEEIMIDNLMKMYNELL